jgi:hypothetical protein
MWEGRASGRAVAACGTAILTPRRRIGADRSVGFQFDFILEADGPPGAGCPADLDSCLVFVS